jgi:sterol desaturase/sphingolipid hydroxylase (fatty acid hydroxylase superfamily)
VNSAVFKTQKHAIFFTAQGLFSAKTCLEILWQFSLKFGDCNDQYFDMNLIVLAIPFFFLLIGIELLVSKWKRLPYYRFNDAITNLSCGIGSQVVGVLIKALTVGGYVILYNYSPWKGKIPADWWMWLVLWLGVDFFYYWFHRLAHEISVLWGSHVVHHQSEEYNLTVALRQAWLQGAFSWVFYLPLAVIGFKPDMFFTIAAVNTLYQFWIHTRLIGKLPPIIEFIFNTPSHHRVHHGVNPEYIDKNHGGTFIIYDRLFGTFQEEKQEVVYGITTQPRSWNPLWLNVEYWVQLFKDVFRTKSFSDKLKLLFFKPGWKPAELGGTIRYTPVTPQQFHKYDTYVSPTITYYVFAQYVLLIAGTSYFLFTENQPLYSHHAALKLFAVAFIIFTVVNLGGLMENKKWVKTTEMLRLAIFPFLVFCHLLEVFSVAVAVFISLSSCFWLWQAKDTAT